MKVLKSRKAAILITVVIAILATLLGVYRTSNKYTRDIEAMFYDGVYLKSEGYTQPGIESHLNNAANAALGLATLMETYPELEFQVEKLKSARRGLLAAETISEKNIAFLEMRERYIDLDNASLNEGLNLGISERDIIAVSQYDSTFFGALNALSASGYNDEVMEYLNSRSFLTRLLVVFTPAREPEYFITPGITR